MPRPDYIVCLECQSEVEDFSWREGEIRKAVCEVCGNDDPDAFALPEDYEQGIDEDDEDYEALDVEEEYEEDLKDYDEEE
jgi:hypothetical protein